MDQSQKTTNKSTDCTSNVRFGSSVQSGLNSAIGLVLLIFLGLAPIPFGSNRPVFWALSGCFLGAACFVYLAILLRQGAILRHDLSEQKLLLIPYTVLLGFILMQMVPLGTWFNPVFKSAGGARITSATLSLSPSMSFLSFIQFASYGILFFMLLQVAHRADRAQKLLVALFVIIVLYAAYSLFALTQLGDTILFIEKWAYQGFATGTFVNRNSFATFLSFGLVLGSVFASNSLLPNSEENRYQRNVSAAALFVLGSVVVFSALVATQSRMGIAAGAVGSLVAISLVFSKGTDNRKWILPTLLTGVFAAATFFLYGGGLLERVGSFESAADVRLALYEQVLGMIANRPWAGYGAGSFELAFPLFHQLPVSPDLVWDKPHNTYLTLWSELGVVFGTIPILLILVIAFKAWNIYRSTYRRWAHASVALGVIATGAIHSLVDFSLEIHAVALLFVAIIAIGIAGPIRSDSANRDN